MYLSKREKLGWETATKLYAEEISRVLVAMVK